MPKLWLQTREIKSIRDKAESLLRNIGCEIAPVPVEAIANYLGAKLRYGPYSDGNLAGMLIKGEECIIAVNSAHPKNRQRFTVAHECGHLLLHADNYKLDKNFFIMKRDENSSLARDKSEIEANQFAAEILMPYKFIRKDLKDIEIDIEDDHNIKELAKRYQVSVQAMTFRFANIFMTGKG